MSTSTWWLQVAKCFSIQRVQRNHPIPLRLWLSTWYVHYLREPWSILRPQSRSPSETLTWLRSVTNTMRAAARVPRSQSVSRASLNKAGVAQGEVRGRPGPFITCRGLPFWHLLKLGRKWPSALDIVSNTRRQLSLPTCTQGPLRKSKIIDSFKMPNSLAVGLKNKKTKNYPTSTRIGTRAGSPFCPCLVPKSSNACLNLLNVQAKDLGSSAETFPLPSKEPRNGPGLHA